MKAAFVLGLLATLAPAGPLAAQAPTPAQREKIRQIIVYGTDPCPRGSGDEIVICARRPENERYRLPESAREPTPSPESESWSVRAQDLEYVGRTGTQSCSTVGPGGSTGCWAQLMRSAREERRAEQGGTTPP